MPTTDTIDIHPNSTAVHTVLTGTPDDDLGADSRH